MNKRNTVQPRMCGSGVEEWVCSGAHSRNNSANLPHSLAGDIVPGFMPRYTNTEDRDTKNPNCLNTKFSVGYQF